AFADALVADFPALACAASPPQPSSPHSFPSQPVGVQHVPNLFPGALTQSPLLEVDIRSFFDTLDHGQLRAILRKRVQDGVLLRLIGKWLHAGVMGSQGTRWRSRGSATRYAVGGGSG